MKFNLIVRPGLPGLGDRPVREMIGAWMTWLKGVGWIANLDGAPDSPNGAKSAEHSIAKEIIGYTLRFRVLPGNFEFSRTNARRDY